MCIIRLFIYSLDKRNNEPIFYSYKSQKLIIYNYNYNFLLVKNLYRNILKNIPRRNIKLKIRLFCRRLKLKTKLEIESDKNLKTYNFVVQKC